MEGKIGAVYKNNEARAIENCVLQWKGTTTGSLLISHKCKKVFWFVSEWV